MYSDDELLMLSGIQHYAFCERQWALIHIEQQWAENMRTVEGSHMHNRVDNPFENETRGNVVTQRSVSMVSYRLGLYGVADVVEYIRVNTIPGVPLQSKTGMWLPVPIEYKRGKPKLDERDEVQLCAQAICLEEMYEKNNRINLNIDKGYLYYGETRHRHEVLFDEKLRSKVESYSANMHKLFKESITPKPIYKSHCKSCSLLEICNPRFFNKPRIVNNYLKNVFEID